MEPREGVAHPVHAPAGESAIKGDARVQFRGVAKSCGGGDEPARPPKGDARRPVRGRPKSRTDMTPGDRHRGSRLRSREGGDTNAPGGNPPSKADAPDHQSSRRRAGLEPIKGDCGPSRPPTLRLSMLRLLRVRRNREPDADQPGSKEAAFNCLRGLPETDLPDGPERV